MARSKQQPSELPSPPAQRKDAPPGKRLPGLAEEPGRERPKWRLSLLDLEHAGSWSWKVDGDALQKIVGFLAQMERLTWTDIMLKSAGNGRRMHHAQAVETLCPEARRRLRDLKLDEFDEMFRFRVGGKPRLWGILYDNVFYAIWWDSDHKVYPLDN